jgi:cytoskeletal protein RodZ
MFDLVGRMRRLQKEAGRRMPAVQRSRRPSMAVLSAPIVAVAGVAAVAGLLFWDERRRAAMRQRMEQLTSSVGASVKSSVNRAAPPVPTATGQD